MDLPQKEDDVWNETKAKVEQFNKTSFLFTFVVDAIIRKERNQHWKRPTNISQSWRIYADY